MNYMIDYKLILGIFMALHFHKLLITETAKIFSRVTSGIFKITEVTK